MNRWKQAVLRAGTLLGLLLLAGCAPGMGGWGDVLGGMGLPGGGEVRGEVSRVDTRSRRIDVSSGWGRSTRVEYDGRTRVIQGQRSYRVSSLRRGDLVSMRVRQDRRGELYADRIYLERSSRRTSYPRDRGDPRDRDYPRDRGSARARVQSFSGRVERVDHNARAFQLQGQRRESYWVTLPANAPSSTRDRLRRLRRGDRVRFEGVWISDRRVQLRRFR